MDTRTLDNSSRASLMADVELDVGLLGELEPRLRGLRGKLFDVRLSLGHGERLTAREVFAEHLRHGDAGPALVVSTAPLRIAAYANELDAVIMLAMPDELVARHELEEGSRLIAACTYAPMQPDQGYARDIIPGPRSSGHFADAAPLIADFLTRDQRKLDLYRRFQIPEQEWQYVASLASQYVDYFGERARDGRPVAVCFE